MSKNASQKTHKASLAKKKYAMENRLKLQNKFIDEVFPVLCTCGKCTSRATVNMKKTCMSYRQIAITATQLKIKTPGNKSKWQITQVKRLMTMGVKEKVSKGGLSKFIDE